MKLGILGGIGPRMNVNIEAIRHAENLGYDSVWTAEAYGGDAVTPAAWILAQTDEDQSGYCHHADAGAHPGDDRHDRHESG